MTSEILEARDPAECPCPPDPMLDRTVVSNPTDRVVEHEEEDFRFGILRVARQGYLKALCRHGDP